MSICLLPTNQQDSDSVCLGYLDESERPSRWKCEDECLSGKDGYLCGSTSHFTNFALLLGGQGGGDPCNSNDPSLITGSWLGDVMLIMASVLFVLVVGVLVIILSTFIRPVQTLLLGREGARIRRTRKRQSFARSATETAF